MMTPEQQLAIARLVSSGSPPPGLDPAARKAWRASRAAAEQVAIARKMVADDAAGSAPVAGQPATPFDTPDPMRKSPPLQQYPAPTKSAIPADLPGLQPPAKNQPLQDLPGFAPAKTKPLKDLPGLTGAEPSGFYQPPPERVAAAKAAHTRGNNLSSDESMAEARAAAATATPSPAGVGIGWTEGLNSEEKAAQSAGASVASYRAARAEIAASSSPAPVALENPNDAEIAANLGISVASLREARRETAANARPTTAQQASALARGAAR